MITSWTKFQWRRRPETNIKWAVRFPCLIWVFRESALSEAPRECLTFWITSNIRKNCKKSIYFYKKRRTRGVSCSYVMSLVFMKRNQLVPRPSYDASLTQMLRYVGNNPCFLLRASPFGHFLLFSITSFPSILLSIHTPVQVRNNQSSVWAK